MVVRVDPRERRDDARARVSRRCDRRPGDGRSRRLRDRRRAASRTPPSPRASPRTSVRNVSATSQRVSCYRPEVAVESAPRPGAGLPGRRPHPVPGRDDGRGPRALCDAGRCGRRERRLAREGLLGVRHPGRPDEPAAPDRPAKWASTPRATTTSSASTSPSTAAHVAGAGPRAGLRGVDGQHRSGRRLRPVGQLLLARPPLPVLLRQVRLEKYDNGSNQTNPTVPPRRSPSPCTRTARTGSERLDHDARRSPRLPHDREERELERSGQAVDRDRHESREPALRTRLRDVDVLRPQPVGHLRVARATRDPTARTRTGRRRRCCRPCPASAGTRTCSRTSRPTGRSTRRPRQPAAAGLLARRHQPRSGRRTAARHGRARCRSSRT